MQTLKLLLNTDQQKKFLHLPIIYRHSDTDIEMFQSYLLNSLRIWKAVQQVGQKQSQQDKMGLLCWNKARFYS